jgi:hypothetical protein
VTDLVDQLLALFNRQSEDLPRSRVFAEASLRN